MKRHLKITLFIALIIFAGIGLLFSAVFVAMQFDLLNVRGANAERNAFFLAGAADAPTVKPTAAIIPATPCTDNAVSSCSWQDTPEWAVVAGGLTKDAPTIARVSAETGVDARLIAAAVVPEQIRFFTAEREVFKRYFEPLKILGSLSKFSLGVSGIKQETARRIEQHAADASSPFYTGTADAALLAYDSSITNRDAELYRRLTDEKNHYYSYLYTALYLKQIMAQWKEAGFPIHNNAYALITLFNIGFDNSHPKTDPQAGGAPITVGGKTYMFGQLGGAFFESDVLREVFP